jgi:hypothetical protein
VEQQKIKVHLDSVFNELSCSDGNGFRYSIYRNHDSTGNTKGQSKCFAGCLKISGQSKCYCCVDHVQESVRPNTVFRLEDHQTLSHLLRGVKEWDPCISFLAVYNWPAIMVDPLVKSNVPVDIASFWQAGVTNSKYKHLYFHANVNYCLKFPSLPEAFLKSNDGLLGHLSDSVDELPKFDICHIFHELITIRNNFIGHSKTTTFNPEEWSLSFTTVMMAANIISQQATKWMEILTSNTNKQWYPEENACRHLQISMNSLLKELLQIYDDFRTSRHNVNSNAYGYEEFVSSVNQFRGGDSFLILIIPPLPKEFIPSVLAAVRWDLVIDFADLGNGVDASESMAWKVMERASGRDGMVKDKHKVSYSKKRIHRNNIEDLCAYLAEMKPIDVAWWQPTANNRSGLLSDLFDGEGLLAAENCRVVRDEVIDTISLVAARIMEQRVLRNRSVQIILPMYSIYEVPNYNASSRRWYFRTAYSSFSKNQEKNYAVPYFIRHLLYSLTMQPMVNVKCSILHQQENSLAPIGKIFL